MPVVGTTVIATATFRDTAGVLVDPSTVVLTVTEPDATTTTPAPTNPSVGVYQHAQDTDQAGNWWFTWVGTTTEGDAVTECVICLTESVL